MILLPPANEVWGKLMFLHLSVIQSKGGGSVPLHARIHTPRQTPPLVDTPLGQTPLGRPPLDTTRYGQQVGGTHPTEMHTCLSTENVKERKKNHLKTAKEHS